MSPIRVVQSTSSSDNVGSSSAEGVESEVRFALSPPESPRAADASKSQCSSLSDGENYEWSGEGDGDSGIANDRNR